MKASNYTRLFVLVVLALLLSACSPEAAGLATTPEGSGPRVIWDLEAKPLPEIPFPNNGGPLDEDSEEMVWVVRRADG